MTVMIEWVTVPAGPVTLEAGGYVTQQMAVDVPQFAIARHPVTNAQFRAFVEGGGYANDAWWTVSGWKMRTRFGWDGPRYWLDRDWNQPQQPVVGVSWYEALAYSRWLGASTGHAVCLPAEQQWQRAAQGDDGREYPWGDADPDARRCNWNRDVDETTPVTAYPNGASPYGVLDMCGNVWEWCRTGWEQGDAVLEGHGSRLLRGGAWSSDSPLSLRAANRSPRDPNTRCKPDTRDTRYGFRVVRNVPR